MNHAKTTSDGKTIHVIVLEGIIGAGKTTLIERLNSHFSSLGKRVAVVREPVQKWIDDGLLKSFYGDQARWAHHFQTVAFVDRINENIAAFTQYGKDAEIYILERSPFSDRVFVDILHSDGNMSDMELRHYREWAGMWMRLMPYAPSLIVYLKPSLGECMRRLRERNRSGEDGVSYEYQHKLQQKHDEIFDHPSVDVGDHDVKCVKFATDENFRDDVGVQQKLVDVLVREMGI